MDPGWHIYLNLVDLYQLKPEKFKEGEFGVECGMINQETKKIKDVVILIHDTDRSKETCEKKIQEIMLKHGSNLPTV